MKGRARPFAAALCLAACLCACGAVEALPGSAAAPDSRSASPEQVEYLDSAFDGRDLYALLTYLDGTGSLVRYDCTAMRCTYLAGERDPREESAPGFVPSVVGDAWVLADGRHLYVLKRPADAELLDEEQKDLGPGYLMRMAPDGTGCRTISLPDDVSLVYEASAVMEGDKMLLVLCQGRDGEEEWYLAQADFDAGTLQHRLDFEEGTTAHLYGACARGPILGLRKEGEGQRFCLYDLEKNALEAIPSGGGETWCLNGGEGAVYYLEGQDVYRYDVATGQSRATGSSLPDGWEQARFEEVTDGYLLLSRGRQGEAGYDRAALCLATGEVFRPALEDEGRRVTIAAVTPGGYLVRLAGIPVRYQTCAPDGTTVENEVRVSHYAMMDKVDYWNNRPNYREFENPAYEAYSFGE